MKKLLIFVLTMIFLLCACTEEKTPEPVLPEEPVVSEPEEEKEPVTEDLYDDHSALLDIDEVTEGTRTVYEITKTGEVVEKEVPNTLYYINFKDGTPAVYHPFHVYTEFCYENLVSTEPEKWEHCCAIEGDYDGNYYRYKKNGDGIYELESLFHSTM